jgi:3-oxoacyl-[acyl-carrier protein] reductase
MLLVARSSDALGQLQIDFAARRVADQEVHVIAADLCEGKAIQRIMQRVQCFWNHVDVLVNNAAILGPVGKIWESDWDEWENTIRVDLLAPIELCRACVPGMIAGRAGKIINLSGGGATGPRPAFSAYATAKAGLVRFSETLAHEVRDANIQVNCVAPGALGSEMAREIVRMGPDAVGAAEYTQAIGALSRGETTFEEAVGLCIFLASPASDRITGKLLSAPWDPWNTLGQYVDRLNDTDVYTLRRITPRDRGESWG